MARSTAKSATGNRATLPLPSSGLKREQREQDARLAEEERRKRQAEEAAKWGETYGLKEDDAQDEPVKGESAPSGTTRKAGRRKERKEGQDVPVQLWVTPEVSKALRVAAAQNGMGYMAYGAELLEKALKEGLEL